MPLPLNEFALAIVFVANEHLLALVRGHGSRFDVALGHGDLVAIPDSPVKACRPFLPTVRAVK